MKLLAGIDRWVRGSVAVAMTVLLIGAAVASPSAYAGEQQRSKDCTLTSTGAIPLTDLGADTYQGAQGGLYPEGRNAVPDAHLAVGLARAAAITPRDASGEPAPDGTVAFAAIGMSNTFREFNEFQRLLATTAGLDPALVLVNAAQGGRDLSAWLDRGNRAWEGLDTALADAGVTAAQVQAVWIKLTDRPGTGGPDGFPDDALSFRNGITELLGELQQVFPNLQVAYLSSRIYGGYNQVSSPSPEPLAYEEGFGVKWTIEDQMNGSPALAADPDGAVAAPWVAWGPYLWADGTTPRSDGLTWECDDLRGDGVHPVRSGQEKVASLLLDFLRDDPTTAWMWTDRALPDSPPNPGDAPPPSTIAGETTTTSSATTSPPTTTDTTDTTEPSPTTTTDQVPTTTSIADTPAVGNDDGGASSPPPVLWMLLGAGLALAIGFGIAWLRTRRT